MKILKATKKDLPAIVDLWKQLYTHHTSFSDPYIILSKNSKKIWEKYIAKEIKNKNSIVLILEDKKQLLGMLHAEIFYPPGIFKKQKICQIHDFVIANSERRKGMGKFFMKELDKILKKKNIKMIRLLVQHKNKQAEKFYKKTGFDDHLLFLVKVLT